ncbi:MAG: acetoacetyl-CoA reductase [Alphaproteobacteria bacterium GM7ARS4]|nr:acetoacetyl-CoA reductase [Alphaproteobacteria bacterium GM7ARS4]
MTRRALITGGTRGIGAAIAIALRQKGYDVAATYHKNKDAAEQFKKDHDIRVYHWDVSDHDACATGIDRVHQDMGDTIDTLVNNAGITQDAAFHKMTFDAWTHVIATNLNSMFTMTRPLINPMRDKQFGRIINIASINGQKGQFGQTNYAATKAAMIGFTKSLAIETATKGITVNAIAPGYIETDMVRAVPEKVRNAIIQTIPVGRLGTADEIADAVLYLADERARFITGATLSINGGQHMTS